MNKRPGHVVVTTEVAVCSFCGRPRTLRSEQHQLGALVRTIVTCETCHRTLSSSIGVASAQPDALETAAVEAPSPELEVAPAETQAATQRAKRPAKAAAGSAAPRKSTAGKETKAAASKSRTHKKTR